MSLSTTLAVGVVAARTLSDREFGRFTFFASLLTLSIACVDGGFGSALVRELSSARPTAEFWARVQRARRVLALVAIAFIGIAAALRSMRDGPHLFVDAAVLAVAVFLLPLRSHQSRSAAAGDFSRLARTRIVADLPFLSLGLLGIVRESPVLLLVAVAVREVAISLGAKFAADLAVERNEIPAAAPTASVSLFPFLSTTIASALAFQSDVFFLDRFVGGEAVGVFGKTQRLLLPIVTAVSLFAAPALPRLSTDDGRRRPQVFAIFMSLLAGTFLPIAAALIAAPGPFLDVIGERSSSTESLLRLFGAALVFMIAGAAGSIELIGRGRIDLWSRIALPAFSYKLAADLYLVPRHGMIGAGWAFLIGEAAIGIGSFVASARLDREILRRSAPVLVAALLLPLPAIFVTWRSVGPITTIFLAAVFSIAFTFGPFGRTRRLELDADASRHS